MRNRCWSPASSGSKESPTASLPAHPGPPCRRPGGWGQPTHRECLAATGSRPPCAPSVAAAPAFRAPLRAAGPPGYRCHPARPSRGSGGPSASRARASAPRRTASSALRAQWAASASNCPPDLGPTRAARPGFSTLAANAERARAGGFNDWGCGWRGQAPPLPPPSWPLLKLDVGASSETDLPPKPPSPPPALPR